MGLIVHALCFLGVNVFAIKCIQTDDTVARGYESWSEYDPREVEEMTSNEETIQIKAEDSYTKLQDKDSFCQYVGRLAMVLSEFLQCGCLPF